MNLEHIPFWKHLSTEERLRVQATVFEKSFSQNELITGNGSSCLGMVCVLEGCIRIYMTSDDGREITLFRVYPGECCVTTAACIVHQITFDTVVMSDTATKLMIIPEAVFERLVEQNIYVKAFMFQLETERFSSAMWVMQQILFKRFDQRLAEFLISQCEKTGKNEIRLTQEQIARDVNTAREVVARMLKQFSGDNLVEIKRGCITVVNMDGLRRVRD